MDQENNQINNLENDKIYVFANPDKKARIRLGDNDYMPFIGDRILYSGPPNVGKRNMILNLMFRIDPPPDSIHLIHYDPDTIEYDILKSLPSRIYQWSPQDFPTINSLIHPESDDESSAEEPNSVVSQADQESIDKPIDEISPLSNHVVIVDEVTSDQLGKVGAIRFERLINYGCTHKNITLLTSIQSMMNLPARCRRGFNCFCLWKQNDLALNKLVSRRAGIKPEVLEDLFQLCESPYDCIYIDTNYSEVDPMRFRLNMINPITIIYDTPTKLGNT